MPVIGPLRRELLVVPQKSAQFGTHLGYRRLILSLSLR